MKIGDTFLIEEPSESLDTHLWIVLSDPSKDSDEVLIVNITNLKRPSDPSCKLEIGDHPWLIKPSCVNYGDPKVVSHAWLQRLLDKGLLGTRDPLTPDLLERVLNGASNSTRMKLVHARILESQGLLPDSPH